MAFAGLEAVLRLHVEGVAPLEQGRLVAVVAGEIGLDVRHAAPGEPVDVAGVGRAAVEGPAIVGDLVAVEEALEGIAVGSVGPLQHAADASAAESVGGGVPGRSRGRPAVVEPAGRDAEVPVRSQPAPEARRGRAFEAASADVDPRAGWGAALHDHVDDAVDRVGAPERAARSADDLDVVDAVQVDVDLLPEHP